MTNVNKAIGVEGQNLEQCELDMIEMTLAELQDVAGGVLETDSVSGASW